MYEGTFNLGFYKPFLPMIQPYSCAESPLWMGKAFLCLHFPEDHPFWTAKESGGIWDEMKAGETRETVVDGPGLCFADHHDNGTAELRPGKVTRAIKDEGGMNTRSSVTIRNTRGNLASETAGNLRCIS